MRNAERGVRNVEHGDSPPNKPNHAKKEGPFGPWGKKEPSRQENADFGTRNTPSAHMPAPET
jgi:hypothetical protein